MLSAHSLKAASHGLAVDALSATSNATLNVIFAALSDPTRRAILARLAQGETAVGELVKPFAISGPAISRHLRVLEEAGLVERRVNAQWRMCRLQPAGLRVADDWLKPYRDHWEQSLDRLVEVLESQTPANDSTAPKGSRSGDGQATQDPSAPVLSPSATPNNPKENP